MLFSFVQVAYMKYVIVTFVPTPTRCFAFLLKKIFVFTTTLKLFGAEMYFPDI